MLPHIQTKIVKLTKRNKNRIKTKRNKNRIKWKTNKNWKTHCSASPSSRLFLLLVVKVSVSLASSFNFFSLLSHSKKISNLYTHTHTFLLALLCLWWHVLRARGGQSGNGWNLLGDGGKGNASFRLIICHPHDTHAHAWAFHWHLSLR